jgi:hypothetical protein
MTTTRLLFMLSPSNILRILATALFMFGLSFDSQAQPAVHTLQVTLGVCRGPIEVLSQQVTANALDMEVQVSIEDCTGSCTGSIEYLLVFTDANNNEVQWQMNETWPWRELDGPFTLKLHHDILPGSQLKEVRNMKIGRCSCST